MSRASRIPALLRELADAFEEFLAEKKRPGRPRKSAVAVPPAEQAAVDAVRRRLRRQGIAA